MGGKGSGRTDTKYTPAIAAEILDRLSDGQSLREICRDDHMPAEATVREWALTENEKRPGFPAHYAKAREVGYMRMADELLEIADDGSNDWMERNGQDNEGWQTNGEALQRSRLRVDTRKWLLSKALPKIYGDKLQQEHTSPDGTMTPTVIERVIIRPDDAKA